MALTKERIAQVEALLIRGGISKREISRQLKISRVTIDKIESKLLFPEENEPQIRILHFNDSDRVLADDLKPEFQRCTGCGGMQQKGIPCQVCKLRKKMIRDYDCYMNELLTPAIVFSPLSTQTEQKPLTTRKVSGKKPKKRQK